MKKVLLLVAAVLSASIAHADSEMDEYQKWRKKELQSFQSYLDENDKAFIKFLKEHSVDKFPLKYSFNKILKRS